MIQIGAAVENGRTRCKQMPKTGGVPACIKGVPVVVEPTARLHGEILGRDKRALTVIWFGVDLHTTSVRKKTTRNKVQIYDSRSTPARPSAHQLS